MLTTIEKVFFLQEIEIFKHIRTEDLAHIAGITDETTVPSGTVIFREGQVSDSMFMVLEGRVRLHRSGEEVMVAGHKDVFGTWALFDDELRIVTATTLEDCRLLRIDKEDFLDLLMDHVRIIEGILKAMVKRLRSLMARVGGREGQGNQ